MRIHFSIKQQIYFSLILIAIGTTSCNPITRAKVLSAVFDSVAEKEKTKLAAAQDSAKVVTNTEVTVISDNILANRNYFHPPSSEGQCEECHDKVDNTRFIASQPELCYGCHEDFTEKYKIMHAPVVGGYCTKCHNPHIAQIDKLLIREGDNLCLTCHKSVAKKTDAYHQVEKNCLDCHDPHGSQKKFMLK